MSTAVHELPLFGLGESSALLASIDSLEQVILSNSGEDVFEEVVKLLFAKLYDERANQGAEQFAAHVNSAKLAPTVRQLFAQAHDRWPRIFSEHSEIRLTDSVLQAAARELAPYRLSQTSLSILDAALEKLLTRSAKGAMGQYFTPRNVVSLAVDVLNPIANEIVLDPACGSAGFLISALKSADDVGEHPQLYGIDFDVKAFRLAQIMAEVAAGGCITLSRRNSLDPQGRDLDGDQPSGLEGFCPSSFSDVILTNPPFGGDVTDLQILPSYQCFFKSRGGKNAGKVPRELLFVERCVQLLKAGGRAAIVVPQGIVANASTAYFRQMLLSECTLLGVVGLHPYAFMPHTGVKTSVIFLEKAASPPDHRVFFAVSRKPGKDSSGAYLTGDGTMCYGNGDDLRSIASHFRSHLAGAGRPWVRPATGEGDCVTGAVPLAEVIRADRFDAEYFDPAVLDLESRLRTSNGKSIRAYVAGRPPVWRRGRHGQIDYVDISSVDNKTGQILPGTISAEEAPSRATYHVNRGDVLVSTVRPERNSVGIVTEEGSQDLIASNGFCVLRPTGISSELLFALCKTRAFRAMLARCATATMYPAVSDDDVLSLPVPDIPEEVAGAVQLAISSAHEHLNQAKLLIGAAISKLDTLLDGPSATAPESGPPPVTAPNKRSRGAKR